MKKIILFPKTDTVILCLPEEWIGYPVICSLAPMPYNFINDEEIEIEIEKINVFRKKIT